MKNYNYSKLNDETECEIEKLLNPDPSKGYDYHFRICLVGDAGVGKTSFLLRYSDGTFKFKYSSTIGVDFRILSLKAGDIMIKLNISDTAGQERFKSISSQYYRSAHGFCFLYDVTNRKSFQNIKEWINSAKEVNDKQVINFIVGNKIDLANSRQVSSEEALKYAIENEMGYFETSAKEDENVNEAFNLITQKILQFYSKNRNVYEQLKCPGDTHNSKKGNYKDISLIKGKPKKTQCCK